MYAGTVYPYEFTGLEDPHFKLANISCASMHVEISCKCVPENCRASSQSQMCHVYTNAVCFIPAESEAFVPSGARPDRLSASVSESGSKSILIAGVGESREDNTAEEFSNLNLLQAIDMDTVV